MSNEIVKYALIGNFYGESILDCFYPFLIKAMKKGSSYSCESLRKEIEDLYVIKMPMHVIKSLVEFGVRKNHLEHKGSKRNPFPVFITEKADEMKSELQDTEAIEKEILFLEKSMAEYFEKKGIDIERETIKDRLERLISNNIVHFCDFFLGRESNANLDGVDKIDNVIIEFISDSETANPSAYSIVSKIFYGSIYKSFLSLTEEEALGVISANYSKTKIYFDANFLFSLLSLHDEEYSEPANELYDLLKRNGFQFRVYDFTIDEMIHVLRGYKNAKKFYPESVRINSLYSSLKRKMYDEIKIKELILDIPVRLEKFGIYKKNTDVDLTDYVPKDEDLSLEFWKIKTKQPPFYHNHDVAVLEKVETYHQSRIYKFEDMDSIFLTADFLLAKFARKQRKHDVNGSLSEIFLDRVLTNLLFLKNPNSRLSLNSILSVMKRETFIKKGIWEKFYHSLKRLIEEGKIDQKSIVNLFCNSYIENELRYLSEFDADTIDDEKIIEILDEANRKSCEDVIRQKEQHEKILAEKETAFGEAMALAETDAESKVAEERARIIDAIKESTKKTSKKIVCFLRIVFGLLLLLPVVFIAKDINDRKDWMDFTSVLRYLFFALDTIALSIKAIWENLDRYITKKIANNRMKQLGLR